MKATTVTRAGLALATLVMVSAASCSRDRDMPPTSSPAPQFQSSDEAVAQGKRDLLDILRSNRGLNLGVDAAQLERAMPAAPLRVVEIDFAKLLAADNAMPLQELGSSRGNATPLQVDGQVVALIETDSISDRWRVSSIGNQALQEDLNQIDPGVRSGVLDYFEVPNLDARIFAATIDGQVRYLTRHAGFSLRQPLSIEELLPRLKADALEFQRLYGEQLKEGRLVR